MSDNVVAIDGPAGSGKSTVSPLVAKRLELKYLDTGMMFRSIAYSCLQSECDLAKYDEVSNVVNSIDLEILSDGSAIIDGNVLRDELRTAEVSQAVSVVAANPDVRKTLLDMQRSWVQSNGGGVLDGRDIGTIVFPNARLKIYLYADVLKRAERRTHDTKQPLEEIIADIERRDLADSSREVAPLEPADDAYQIDSTHLTIDEVVDQVVALY